LPPSRVDEETDLEAMDPMSFPTPIRSRSAARRWLPLAAAAAAALCLLAARAWAAPGDLDRSFSGDGIAQLGSDTRLFGAVAQPDGKLVAVGDQGNLTGTPQALVVRFTTGGALDPSFSGDGVFTGAPATIARSVAMQGTKVVVAGSLTSGGMLALRLNPNGSADGSFSGDGVVTALEAEEAEGRAVAVQGDKLLVGGGARLAADGFERLALARFNPNGSPDASFGGGTRLYADFGRRSFANAITVDSANRILVAGSSSHDLQTTNLITARLRPDGDQDPSFGGNVGVPGLFARDYAKQAGFAAAYEVAVDSRGRPVLGGAAINGSSDPEGSDAIAVRLTAGGAPDGSFSDDGVAYLPATSDKNQYSQTEPFPGARGLVLAGSRIVLGGYFDQLTQRHLALWALTESGAPVPGFGTGGRVTTLVAEGALLTDIALAPSGRIYGVGATASLFDPPTGLAAAYAGFPVSGPRCLGAASTIVGTAARDVLRGTGRRDVIVGLGGPDRIASLGGNDLACGGGGNDRINLGAGNDRGSGGGGRDVINGGGGRDRLFGNAGVDRLLGGAGRDFLRGGGGRDILNGGPGRNNIRQ
jgi:uncharacterized delta-60 repeat protein